MKNELLDLEHLITVVLNPANLTAKNLDEEFLERNMLFAEKEMDRIKQKLFAVSIKSGTKRCIELYYRQQQANLIILSDKMYCYLQNSGPESIYRVTNETSIIEFYKKIALVPETLLHFIEKYFPCHFDQNMDISHARRANEKNGISHCLKCIKKELKGANIDNELFWIICSPFEAFLLPDKNITYRELAYLLSFQQRVNKFLTNNEKINGSEQLCELLIFLNNNSLRFLKYFTIMHKEAAKNYHTIPDRILYYLMQLKEINQQPVKRGIVFKPAVPSMKDQIANWLHDEIHYYEKQWQLLSNNPCAPTTTQEKLSTSLSVAELAFFMKLLHDAKVIKSDNSTELMNFVANNVRTDRSETISPGSLRNKYYNVDSSTVEKIKIMIRELMNLMRKY